MPMPISRHRHRSGTNDAGRAAMLTGDDYRADGLARCRRWRPTRVATVVRCICRRVRQSRSTVSCMSAIRWRSPWPTRSNEARDAAERIVVEYAPRPQSYRRASREQARRSFTTIARKTRPTSIRRATRPRPMPPSPVQHTSSSSASSSIASPPIRSNRAAQSACTTRARPLHVALRLPTAVAVPQRYRPHDAQHPGVRIAADHRRYRRLLRPARLCVPRNHPDAVGGAQASAGR